ncbi:molybdate ABC transporter substrate-binding protein [Desulfovibrio inopinatus]|uniref:molybdate ABC transporter substrate-binding protein n=1 Tax=Desulfovibrio inopinatus TaxID=102109 RepID=UPI0003FEF48C|nr:molybdate ABC transporter substrate-binding protein [Desulfovibrio inopinatus]
MNFIRLLNRYLLIAFLLLASVSTAFAEDTLTIAAGAGYKQLVTALCKAYVEDGHPLPQQVFGNMGQVIAQSKQSGVIDLVIGDKRFLDNSDLSWSNEEAVGRGKLILAVAKGVSIDGIKEVKVIDAASGKSVLTNPAVKRIAMPDTKKAIYGRAASQFLEKTGLGKDVESNLLVVGTVPQVSAYVISGEVDLGFINLTDALAIADKAEAIIPVDESLYAPIQIIAKTLASSPNPDAAATFDQFLKSDTARAIVAKQGL